MQKVRWAFNITGWRPTEAEWCHAVQLVQLEEKERLERFRYQVDMIASLVGRLMLRGLAIQTLGTENRQVKLFRTERGKPLIIGGCAGLDYNVSHAGDWVVLAAGGGMIGADVMKLEDCRVKRIDEFFRLMKKQFTETEWLYIKGTQGDSETEQLRRFFRYWTLKESYVKATGTGLNINLQSLEFRVKDNIDAGRVEIGSILKKDGDLVSWKFEESLLDSQHQVSVALDTPDGTQANLFKTLKIKDIFLLFNHSSKNVTIGDINDESLLYNAENLLRPINSEDYELFVKKEHPKPF